MNKILVISVLSIAMSTAIASEHVSKTIPLRSGAPVLNSGVFTLHFGDGYSSQNKMGMGLTALNDLKNISVIDTDVQRGITMANQISCDDLTLDLNVDTSGSGGWGLFSGS
mgnify:CR=1 FL=1